ncbi:MAG: hypothetical protein NXI19_18460 [Alphaproteobacteria bacterium]|nr:hypothetical protein [Alphaproteobacteria bacterium]
MNITKIRDSILILAFLGIWLLMPPMLDVFNQRTSLFGMPLIVVYVFGVWLVLIGLTAVLATRISDRAPEPGGRDDDLALGPDIDAIDRSPGA